MTSRVRAFVIVGAIGFVVQLALLQLAVSVWQWSYLAATALAVEAAVLHNFIWHERWTWRDRIRAAETSLPAPTDERTGVSLRRARLEAGARARGTRLLRFHVANGATSVAGNLLVTAVGVEFLRLPPIAANALAVAAVSIANYLAADRWVFEGTSQTATAPADSTTAPRTAPQTVLGVSLAVTCVLTLLTPASASAEPEGHTVAAWNRHVASVESAWYPAREVPAASAEPMGEAIRVDGGTINQWRGSVLLRGTTVERLVHALQTPGLPPPADDILESRVLFQGDNRLHVYMKLARTALITVTYDTEHDVTFRRHGQGLATSQSIATSIREVGGNDRGFLWRLNSYWTYRQVGTDVRVDLLSLSLSRNVPALAIPIAMPIVNRIARESTARALEALRRFGEHLS
jgi:putative flippase GtrA